MRPLAHNFCIVMSLVGCIHLLGANAYPILNVRRLFDAAIDGRYKKSGLTLPQTDVDVIELEHLKQNSEDNKNSGINDMPIPVDESVSASDESSISRLDYSPEHELITTTTTKAPVTPNAGGQTDGEQKPEVSESDANSQHRPPTLQHHDGGKMSNNQNSEAGESSSGPGPAVPAVTKPFYGAARLAFGQNPEVLPTSASTSTTTVTPPMTNESISEAITAATTATTSASSSASPLPSDLISHSHPASNTDQGHLPISLDNAVLSRQINKEEVKDDLVIKNTKSESRRSITLIPPKAAESLFKHKDGQYSSFDMAQYVFWTGDEAGVARAVEEFIQQGLMSRESAIAFLRDIRLGIEYLQNSYANRMFPSEFRGNTIKKTFNSPPMTLIENSEMRAGVVPSTTARTTISKTIAPIKTTAEKPFPRVNLERTDSRRNLQKTLEHIPSLMRFQEENSGRKQAFADLSEIDKSSGKAKIAEFLYTEYSLEEVIYQIAKVMFSDSLGHGSEKSQEELQKLVEFLEEEGKRGTISIDLQKKILDVLLSALSDTLLENPKLLASARSNLGNAFHKIPANSLDTVHY